MGKDYQKVTASLQTWHHTFIGPRLPAKIKDRLYYEEYKKLNRDRIKKRCAERYAENREQIIKKNREHYHRTKVLKGRPPKMPRIRKRVQFTLQPSHPLFIGPRLPKKERARLAQIKLTEDPAYRERKRIMTIDYVANNRAAIRERQRRWRLANKEHVRKSIRDRRSERIKTDVSYVIKGLLRSRLYRAVSMAGASKKEKTMELLGCSISELKTHIECQFKPGMTWGNRGVNGWHIDHIIPCAAFDLTDPDQQAMCFHYTNLQPLWANENMSKNDRLTPKAIALIREKIKAVETDGPIYIERAG